MAHYRVDVIDFGNPDFTESHDVVVRTVRRVTLARAWQIVARQSRRGVRLYGGSVAQDNWGARGGTFPQTYRNAVIRVESPRG